MQNHNVFTYYLVEGLMKLLASGSMNLCQKWGKNQTQAKPQISPSAWSYSVLGCDLAKEAGASQLSACTWLAAEIHALLQKGMVL